MKVVQGLVEIYQVYQSVVGRPRYSGGDVCPRSIHAGVKANIPSQAGYVVWSCVKHPANTTTTSHQIKRPT